MIDVMDMMENLLFIMAITKITAIIVQTIELFFHVPAKERLDIVLFYHLYY